MQVKIVSDLQRKKIRLLLGLLIFYVRIKWSNKFKIIRGKKCELRIFYLVKMIFDYKGYKVLLKVRILGCCFYEFFLRNYLENRIQKISLFRKIDLWI